jgi:hypothetical protein
VFPARTARGSADEGGQVLQVMAGRHSVASPALSDESHELKAGLLPVPFGLPEPELLEVVVVSECRALVHRNRP